MENQMLWVIIGVVVIAFLIWFFIGKSNNGTNETHHPLQQPPPSSKQGDDHELVEGYATMREMQTDINNFNPGGMQPGDDLIEDINAEYQPPASGPSAVQQMDQLLDSYNVSTSNPMFEEMATMSYNPTPTSILLTPRLTETSISAAVQGDPLIAPSAPRDVFRPLYGRRDATNKSLFGCNKINLAGPRTNEQIIVDQSQNPQVGIGPNIGIGGSADVVMN